jgi:hypothetical protein
MSARIVVGCLIAVTLVVAACGSSESSAARARQSAVEAQERAIERRLEFVDQYRACVDDAAGDNSKVEACDTYLRAAAALR